MKPFVTLFIIILLCSACVDEDYFGLSSSADITNIEVSSQSGNPYIDAINDSIRIDVANGTNLEIIVIRSLKLSSFATATIAVGDTLDFTNGTVITNITAEDNTVSPWILSVFEIGSQPQIDNSDFSVWHNEGSYLDPGVDDASSVWGTSNPGVVFAGIDPNAEQVEITPNNYGVKLTTRYTRLGAVVNKPIAAGSVFTGDFLEDNISFNNPLDAIEFGTPFTATPTSFSVDFKYTPGETNIDANQNNLSYPDTGDMYILLERREDNITKRVATAWHRIDAETGSDLQNITVDFTYGELPADTPSYMLPKDGELYAETSETPTHLVAVFTSSANGDYFEGAVGSELIIDNVILNY
ncbi:PCMD domain-containing protein [Joostella sp. CR20]|uniref:PCMD domain-containing protein n=1 Tax=Joostella sp. CR20 TaxID=2804312 RepID=UPI00313E46DC